MRQRRSRNTISRLKDEANIVYNQEEQIEGILVKLFLELFTSGGISDSEAVLENVHTKLTENMAAYLWAPFSATKVQQALKQMHPNKLPGPNGMSFLFFQKYWHIIGSNVTSFVLNIQNNKPDVSSINETYLVLFNVVYKITSKMIEKIMWLIPALYTTFKSFLSQEG